MIILEFLVFAMMLVTLSDIVNELYLQSKYFLKGFSSQRANLKLPSVQMYLNVIYMIAY